MTYLVTLQNKINKIIVGQHYYLPPSDVSAAFDSVDHDLLLSRLSITFGIRDLPLLWITSYLSERSSSTIFHSSRSPWRPAPFGLPQGSVLGPLLYILFTADLESLLTSCSLMS